MLQLHIVSKVVGLEKPARKTSNFVFRDDVNKNERGLNVRLGTEQSELRRQTQRQRSQEQKATQVEEESRENQQLPSSEKT